MDASALLARLVAFDSTSHRSNLPLAEFLAGYLADAGLRVEMNPSADGGKANLIAFLGPEPAEGDRRGLVLSGHMDTVPALEPDWRSDPFSLTDGGDRWFGRGTSDMKGFLALAAHLAAARAAEAARWQAPLVLLFTYDEEVGTLGARRFTESFAGGRSLPRNAVIGEPTELRVVRLHKGHLKLRITLHGLSAHSGYPHLGRNAIEPAARVIAALGDLRRELEAERPEHGGSFPEVPFVPLNVGTVHGGSAINVVPDRCVVEVGVRPLPGMDSAELAGRIGQAVRRGAAGWAPEPEIEILSDSPPLVLAENAPVHRHLCSLVEQPQGESVAFATDAGWLQRLDLDCAIFGPGSIEVAHKPNEFLPKDQFFAASGLFSGMIRHFCLEGRA